MPATRVVKEEPIEWWRCPIFEYGHELTLNKEWLDIVAMDLQQTQSILRSSDRQRSIIHDEVSFDRRLERLAPVGKHPRMQIAARETDLDAVVAAQVIRRFRLAMPFEIAGRSDHDDPLRTADPHGDHVALEAFANPQSCIETARYDIGERIVDREFKRDFGVSS